MHRGAAAVAAQQPAPVVPTRGDRVAATFFGNPNSPLRDVSRRGGHHHNHSHQHVSLQQPSEQHNYYKGTYRSHSANPPQATVIGGGYGTVHTTNNGGDTDRSVHIVGPHASQHVYPADGGGAAAHNVSAASASAASASATTPMLGEFVTNAVTGRQPFSITLWDGRYQNSEVRRRVLVHSGLVYLTQVTERAARSMGCAPASEVLFTPMGQPIARIEQLEPEGDYLMLPAGCAYRADTVPLALLQRLVVARDLALMNGGGGPPHGTSVYY